MLTIYPTDTVWGLGAPVLSESENRLVRQVKGSPLHKPLSVLFYDLEQLRENLSLPPGWEEDRRLEAFFAKEGTLAVPRKGLKASWGGWVYGESSFATVRCLPLNFLRKEGCPFTTTSLNLQGESPIVDREEALAFSEQMKLPHRLISDESIRPSGMSSTILAVLPNGKVECWRQGHFYKDILKFLD